MTPQLTRIGRLSWCAAFALAMSGALPAAAQMPNTVAPAQASGELENTYWKLIELEGATVSVAPNQGEPHIVLRGGDQPSVRGSGGCNRLLGRYRADGDAIAFERMAITMMACAEGMRQEQAFLAALAAARTWVISGQQLQLRDGEGKPLARFEARHVK